MGGGRGDKTAGSQEIRRNEVAIHDGAGANAALDRMRRRDPVGSRCHVRRPSSTTAVFILATLRCQLKLETREGCMRREHPARKLCGRLGRIASVTCSAERLRAICCPLLRHPSSGGRADVLSTQREP
jgi:hypothetical protein